jgi:uncharacterized BrkB/YihY/UPF0761 family membrane protein
MTRMLTRTLGGRRLRCALEFVAVGTAGLAIAVELPMTIALFEGVAPDEYEGYSRAGTGALLLVGLIVVPVVFLGVCAVLRFGPPRRRWVLATVGPAILWASLLLLRATTGDCTTASTAC